MTDRMAATSVRQGRLPALMIMTVLHDRHDARDRTNSKSAGLALGRRHIGKVVSSGYVPEAMNAARM